MATPCPPRRSRRPLRRPATAGSVMPRKSSGTRSASPAARTAAKRRDRSASASRRCRPISTSRRSASRRAAAREQRRIGLGVEIVHEMQARAVAQRTERRRRRSRRAAPPSGRRGSIRRCRERRCLGTGDEPLRGRFDAGEVVGLLREPQQRQLAVGVARADEGQRLARSAPRRRQTPAPSRRDGRCVPRGPHRWIATDGHATLPAPAARDQPPLAGVTCGRPTTVTSMPASSMRLRDPLHVVHGHRLHQAVALVDVIDAEILDLDLHELRGDLAGGVEAQRVGTRQERLRLGELLLGRAVLRRGADFGLRALRASERCGRRGWRCRS